MWVADGYRACWFNPLAPELRPGKSRFVAGSDEERLYELERLAQCLSGVREKAPQTLLNFRKVSVSTEIIMKTFPEQMLCRSHHGGVECVRKVVWEDEPLSVSISGGEPVPSITISGDELVSQTAVAAAEALAPVTIISASREFRCITIFGGCPQESTISKGVQVSQGAILAEVGNDQVQERGCEGGEPSFIDMIASFPARGKKQFSEHDLAILAQLNELCFSEGVFGEIHGVSFSDIDNCKSRISGYYSSLSDTGTELQKIKSPEAHFTKSENSVRLSPVAEYQCGSPEVAESEKPHVNILSVDSSRGLPSVKNEEELKRLLRKGGTEDEDARLYRELLQIENRTEQENKILKRLLKKGLTIKDSVKVFSGLIEKKNRTEEEDEALTKLLEMKKRYYKREKKLAELLVGFAFNSLGREKIIRLLSEKEDKNNSEEKTILQMLRNKRKDECDELISRCRELGKNKSKFLFCGRVHEYSVGTETGIIRFYIDKANPYEYFAVFKYVDVENTPAHHNDRAKDGRMRSERIVPRQVVRFNLRYNTLCPTERQLEAYNICCPYQPPIFWV